MTNLSGQSTEADLVGVGNGMRDRIGVNRRVSCEGVVIIHHIESVEATSASALAFLAVLFMPWRKGEDSLVQDGRDDAHALEHGQSLTETDTRSSIEHVCELCVPCQPHV